LTATLRTSDNYVPQSFTIKGNTSRISSVDTEVTDGSTANIRQGSEKCTVQVPQTFLTISGYAPGAVQMEMMRYWLSHGKPAPMTTLPIGAVKIVAFGLSSTVKIPKERPAHGRQRKVHHSRIVGHARALRSGRMGTD
jgi:hypothetical protein